MASSYLLPNLKCNIRQISPYDVYENVDLNFSDATSSIQVLRLGLAFGQDQ